jgi:hypothetical protein
MLFIVKAKSQPEIVKRVYAVKEVDDHIEFLMFFSEDDHSWAWEHCDHWEPMEQGDADQ